MEDVSCPRLLELVAIQGIEEVLLLLSVHDFHAPSPVCATKQRIEMRRELRSGVETVDSLIHERDVDFALRVPQNTLDDGHWCTGNPEWVHHQEARGQRLHLALDVVQERCHGCVETTLHDQSVAVAGQIRLLGFNKPLE